MHERSDDDHRYDRRHNMAAGIAVCVLTLGGVGVLVSYDIGHQDGILTHRLGDAASDAFGHVRDGIHDAATWVADHTED